MGNRVVHFEIVGQDGEALQKFYREAFAWKIEPLPPGPGGHDYAMVRPDGEGAINGGIGGNMGEYGGHVTFYVEVPNLEEALTNIEGLGGKTMMPPDQVPGGPRIAMFADPEGHAVGLVEANSGGTPPRQ